MKSAFIRLGVVACFLGFGVTAQAQTAGVSYTYIDGQYVSGKIDIPSSSDVDADGARFSGSLALTDSMYVLGGFERLRPDDIEIDDGLGNITVIPTGDLDTYGIGFGFNTPTIGRPDNQYLGGVMDQYSFYADARYLGQDSGSSDRNGWSLNTGLRSVNFTRLEVILGVGYEKFETQDGEFTAQGQILFSIANNLQLRGGVDWNDAISRWNLGLRYNFGNYSIF